MVKIIVYIFAAAVLVGLAVSLPTPEEEEDRPGYCKVGDFYIKEGESGGGPIGECSRVTCDSATPGKMAISGVGCGTFVPSQGCKLTDYDNTKRYPDCCPKEVCNDVSEED